MIVNKLNRQLNMGLAVISISAEILKVPTTIFEYGNLIPGLALGKVLPKSVRP
jgi:hypothetical protein